MEAQAQGSLASDGQTRVLPVHRFGEPRPNLGTSHLSCSTSPGPILGGRASRAPTSSSSPTPTHPSPGQGPAFLASCTLAALWLHPASSLASQHGPLYPVLHRDSQTRLPTPAPQKTPYSPGGVACQASAPLHPPRARYSWRRTLKIRRDGARCKQACTRGLWAYPGLEMFGDQGLHSRDP